jgi:transcriptional regulator with XRE-family HTH domain
MIVGERLKGLRKDTKISSEELSKVIGVTRQQVQRYETNKTDITSDVLIKLADFFDVSTDYLLGRADLKTPYYTREPKTLYVELGNLLRVFSPDIVGRFIKSLGLKVAIREAEGTNKRQICVDIPDNNRL